MRRSGLRIATLNLWSANEPWVYTESRGITRGAVPESPATTLRLPGGAWNRRRNLIANALGRLEADVVALQEVVGHSGDDGRTSADQLGDDLSLTVSQHEKYASEPGHALAFLTRVSLRQPRVIRLTEEPLQIAFCVVICVGKVKLNLINTHLTTRSEESRIEAVRSLHDVLATRPADEAVIVLGDWNSGPDSETLKLATASRLIDGWKAVRPHDPGFTMPSHAPEARIDYILVDHHFTVESAGRFGDVPDRDGFFPSDHLGVVVSLRRAVHA